jgi:S1-C subfamily serine protease
VARRRTPLFRLPAIGADRLPGPMTGLDWIIAAAVVLLALFGSAQGFVSAALALLGFALGAWIGTRVGPAIVPGGRSSPWAPVFGLLGALVAGGLFAAGLNGVGSRLRRIVRLPGLGLVDGLLGAAFTGCLALGVVWVLGAVAFQQGGDLRRQAQRSEILLRLNDLLPPSGPLLNAIGNLDPFPRIDGPEAGVGPPAKGIARDPQVRAAQASVVKIRGTACGAGVEGSGWVAAPGVVVTNAHVIAGQHDTRVLPNGDGGGNVARAIAFIPRDDVAVLQVDGLDAPALSLATDPQAGTSGAILGYPLDGPFDVRAGRLGVTRDVISQDAYGQGPVRRRIASLRGAVRPGNSGGPMVDGQGRVATTIFAATTRGPRGGYGVPNSVVRQALARARGGRTVSTGACA